MATQNDIKAMWFDRVSELLAQALSQQEIIDHMKKEIAEKDAKIQALQKTFDEGFVEEPPE